MALGLGAAHAAYPERPITVVMPFAAGAQTDNTGRIFAELLSAELGQSIIVENRVGAHGRLASTHVSRANPDGYTLLFTSNGTISAAPALYKDLPYDPLKSFDHIARITNIPWVLATSRKLPVESVDQLIEYAKKHPGALNGGYVSASSRFALYWLMKKAELNVVEIAYKATSQMFIGLSSGDLQFAFFTSDFAVAQAQSDTIRILGITTPEPWAGAPHLPPIAKTIPDFNVVSWLGVAAPKGTPADVLEKLENASLKVIKSDKFKEQVAKLHADVAPLGSVELGKLIESEIVMWNEFAKDAGIEPQ